MTAQDPDRLTLADVARLPDYVQRAIARTIDPTLPAEPSAARAMTRPGWSNTRDAEHPIRWDSADGNETAYLTRAEALRRLANAYRDPAAALDCGRPVRTPFAWYTVTEPEPEPMTQYDADRAALARAYRDADAEAEAIYRREARRARDYDDGIIADDDH